MTRVLISAGDPSGDRYSAALVQELKARQPDWDFEGFGGPRLCSAGVRMLSGSRATSVMGVAEVIAGLPAHVRALRSIRIMLKAGRFDLVVLVDYPDFNLRLSSLAARAGVPVLYYVAPQLWAWRPGRVVSMKRSVTRLAAIFPFERDYFGARGIETEWVGHPLMDQAPLPDRASARRQLGIPDDKPVVALLPGSRRHEVHRMWPLFRDTARLIGAARPETLFVVGAHVEHGGESNFIEHAGDVTRVLAVADTALTKSGTISLQTALARVPTVIGHRMHPLTYAIAKRLIQTPAIGMSNILLGEPLIPEFVQDAACPRALADAVAPILPGANLAARDEQLGASDRLRAMLGGPGAGARVAEMALEMVS